MNRNKKTKNVKQNKAIDNITERVEELSGMKATFDSDKNAKNK